FFFQAEDGIRDFHVTGVQTCALPIWPPRRRAWRVAPVVSLIVVGGGGFDFLPDLRDPALDAFLIAPPLDNRGVLPGDSDLSRPRSEERRVGKGCRSGGAS